jgi:hypothetical protein
MAMTADEIIARLGLEPHPEGGHYHQTFRAPALEEGKPRGVWQAARSLGNWTLVGCTVAPAFQFEHFEMAPPGWEPGV